MWKGEWGSRSTATATHAEQLIGQLAVLLFMLSLYAQPSRQTTGTYGVRKHDPPRSTSMFTQKLLYSMISVARHSTDFVAIEVLFYCTVSCFRRTPSSLTCRQHAGKATITRSPGALKSTIIDKYGVVVMDQYVTCRAAPPNDLSNDLSNDPSNDPYIRVQIGQFDGHRKQASSVQPRHSSVAPR